MSIIVFSVVVWVNDDYWLFATVIVLMSTSSIISDVYQVSFDEQSNKFH